MVQQGGPGEAAIRAAPTKRSYRGITILAASPGSFGTFAVKSTPRRQAKRGFRTVVLKRIVVRAGKIVLTKEK